MVLPTDVYCTDTSWLTAHCTCSAQTRPQPLKQHDKFPPQSSSLLHSITHGAGLVTAGHPWRAATRWFDPVSQCHHKNSPLGQSSRATQELVSSLITPPPGHSQPAIQAKER